MSELTPVSPNFFAEVRSILAKARSKAASAVNTAMVEAYWFIGKRIVEEEQDGQAKAAYGTRMLEELSRRLADQFGKGFSVANLRNFRQFYLTYADEKAIHCALRSELSWTYHRLIMREDDGSPPLPSSSPDLDRSSPSLTRNGGVLHPIFQLVSNPYKFTAIS